MFFILVTISLCPLITCGSCTYYLLINNKYESFEYLYHSIYISSHNYKLLNYMFSSVTILLLVIDILVHMTDTQYPTTRRNKKWVFSSSR